MSSGTVLGGWPGSWALATLGRRVTGNHDVDEWGLDPDLIALAEPLLALRWDIIVEHVDRLPGLGGALLVYNRRFGVSEPWVLARGVRRASGRFVRTVGVPDVAPLGPALRRFGGVLDRTDEVTGLLRAGQLVGLPLTRDLRGRERAGGLEVDRLEAAIATASPVVPVALVGHEIGRAWRLVIGRPIAPVARGGPLAAAELAETAHRGVQTLLDDALPRSWRL